MTNKSRLGLAIALSPIAFLILVGVLHKDQWADHFLEVFWVAFPVGMILILWGVKDLVAGPGKLLTTGTLAVATVNEARRTGTIINDVNLVVEVRLTVQPEGAAAYQATVKTIVPIHQPDLIARGQKIAVRFDPAKPTRVAIDPNPPGEWVDRNDRPTPSAITQDEILATGSPAIAQIVSVRLTGKTVGGLSGGNPDHPERFTYPAALIELMVQPEQGDAFSYQAIYGVPPQRAAGLARDSLVPVRYVQHAGLPLVAIDWERIPGPVG